MLPQLSRLVGSSGRRAVGGAPAPDGPGGWRVLFVCADPGLQPPVVYRLAREGYGVSTTDGTLAPLSAGWPAGYDVLLLRATLPAVPELDVLGRLPSTPGRGPAAVVVVLTGLVDRATEEQARVAALTGGAHDVVAWSDSLDELMLRLRALRRRQPAAPVSELFEVGALRVDVAGRDARVAGRPVHLTRAEFVLLHALLAARGRLLTRPALAATLAAALADGTAAPRAAAINAHIARLRAKLGAMRTLIRTVPTAGYRLVGPRRRA